MEYALEAALCRASLQIDGPMENAKTDGGAAVGVRFPPDEHLGAWVRSRRMEPHLRFIFADRCADELRISGQRTGLAYLKPLILFCKRHQSVSECEGVRLIPNRLFVIADFEARIFGSFLREVVKRGIKISQRL